MRSRKFFFLSLTYVELPDDLLRRRLRLDPAVKVDVPALVDAIRGDGGPERQLNTRRI